MRHAYEPSPPKDDLPSGRGYHNHKLAGASPVVEIVNETCVKLDAPGRMIPVFLGALLEIVPSQKHAVETPYLVPLAGPYREPKAA